MDLEAAIERIGMMPTLVIGGCEVALNELLVQGQDIAINRSSGTKTLAEMRRDDHPYAKRHALSGLDALYAGGEYPPGVINSQSGQFVGGWQITKSGNLSGSVINDTEHAKYLVSGAGSMIVRPVEEAVSWDIEAIVEHVVEQAIIDALTS
jgi:hypothetical protein